MELDALGIFARVAELASFTRAAEDLGVPKARVSTSIQRLETQLGTRLLHRTTRTVRLTLDGEQFYQRCKEVLTGVDELQSLFLEAPNALRGRLRVDMPTAFARWLVIPRLGEFLNAHPQLEIELGTSDRQVDLVHEGFDCVVRAGTLQISDLVARRLGNFRMVNCASPAYLETHGVPRTLDDLDRHYLVHYSPTFGGKLLGWEYRDERGYRFKPMRGAVTVNNVDAYQAACLAGLGLIQAPAAGLKDLIAQGMLVEVMAEFEAEPMPVSLLYPNRRNVSKRLEALMTWFAQILAPHLEPAGALNDSAAESKAGGRL